MANTKVKAEQLEAAQTNITSVGTLTGLALSGSLTGTSATFTTADNTAQLTLTSTDADANSGPNLDLYRNSSSPAASDVLGTIFFHGEDGAGNKEEYARIQSVVDAKGSGSEVGVFQIFTNNAGTLTNNRFEIDGTEVTINESSGNFDFRVESNDNANMLFVDGGNNRVGIGTASPTELLEVNSTGASTAIEVSAGAASTTTGEAKIVLRSLHSASGTTYSRSEIASLGVAGGDSDLIFRTTTDTNGPQERMRINSSGNVGIGVTSITHALEINRASSSAAYAVVGNGGDVQSYIGVAGDNLPVLGSFTNHDLRLVTNATERMRILSGGQFAVNDTGTSSHQMKLTSSTMGLRIKSGNGGYSSLTWSGDNETTIGSLTTYDGRLYIGAQNSGGTGSNGEIVVKPGTSSSTGGVGTTLGRTPDVSLEVGGPLKIVNNTGGGISQTHTNMTVANSGKLLINFGSIGTMTVGDTIVFEYAATSWKSWFFKIRWSSTGGYMGELWAGGYNNSSDGYQILNPRYYAAASGDGSSQSTVEGATLTVTRSGQENTMTLTLTGTHVHPLFEIEYACGGGEGYPNASKATITVNS